MWPALDSGVRLASVYLTRPRPFAQRFHPKRAGVSDVILVLSPARSNLLPIARHYLVCGAVRDAERTARKLGRTHGDAPSKKSSQP